MKSQKFLSGAIAPASLVVSAIAALVPIGPATGATVSVVNSSFEDPVIGVAGSSAVTITGWSKTGMVQLVTPSLGPPTGVFSGQDGVQAVFTGNGSISQTLAPIVPGVSYTLSSYVSLLGFPNGALGNYTLTIGYESNNTPATFTPFAVGTDLQGPLDSTWLLASIIGVAPLNASGALAIKLGGDGEFWDSVSVTTDPTPLPAALPLFATSLGAWGLLGWRRRKTARATDASP